MTPQTMEAVTIRTTPSGSRELYIDGAYPQPIPKPGEALIKVLLAGICGTDLELLSGYKSLYGFHVIGHEFVGELITIAPHANHANPNIPTSPTLQPGTRVVAEINCVPCTTTTSRNAAERAQDGSRTAMGIFGRDGVFASYVAVPLENLHRVPDGVSNRQAVFAEPIAAACQILQQVQIKASWSVGVLGAGRLGWLVAQVLFACGKDVTVLSRGRDAARDERLAAAYGVRLRLISTGSTCIADEFDVVVDCTGSSNGLESALELVKARGTVVLKSTVARDAARAVDMTPAVVKELTVVGSRCGPFPVALRLLERGVVDPTLLVECVLKRREAVDGFRRAAEAGALKVLLE